MHAHPMITPLLPLQSPEQIDKEYPSDAAMAYHLIWDNMLAHIRSPHQVREDIHLYQIANIAIGLRTLTSDSPDFVPLLMELDSYRINAPAFPVGALECIESESLNIHSIDPVFVPISGRETDVKALITWLDTLRVTSQGRLGSILDELEDRKWIKLDGTQYKLTSAGEDQLHNLNQATDLRLSGMSTFRWRAAFEAYSSNNIGLDEFLAESNQIFGTSLDMPIQELEGMVTGSHSAEEAYALRENLALHATSSARFPIGMDPDRLLSQDNPFRAMRDNLEDSLSKDRTHDWLCLSESERVAIRLGAEIFKLSDVSAVEQYLESVLFDVRLRWVIGLGADSLPPSIDTATRAYTAWTNAVR